MTPAGTASNWLQDLHQGCLLSPVTTIFLTLLPDLRLGLNGVDKIFFLPLPIFQEEFLLGFYREDVLCSAVTARISFSWSDDVTHSTESIAVTSANLQTLDHSLDLLSISSLHFHQELHGPHSLKNMTVRA